jgi:hypothetical protein
MYYNKLTIWAQGKGEIQALWDLPWQGLDVGVVAGEARQQPPLLPFSTEFPNEPGFRLKGGLINLL